MQIVPETSRRSGRTLSWIEIYIGFASTPRNSEKIMTHSRTCGRGLPLKTPNFRPGRAIGHPVSDSMPFEPLPARSVLKVRDLAKIPRGEISSSRFIGTIRRARCKERGGISFPLCGALVPTSIVASAPPAAYISEIGTHTLSLSLYSAAGRKLRKQRRRPMAGSRGGRNLRRTNITALQTRIYLKTIALYRKWDEF